MVIYCLIKLVLCLVFICFENGLPTFVHVYSNNDGNSLIWDRCSKPRDESVHKDQTNIIWISLKLVQIFVKLSIFCLVNLVRKIGMI